MECRFQGCWASIAPVFVLIHVYIYIHFVLLDVYVYTFLYRFRRNMAPVPRLIKGSRDCLGSGETATEEAVNSVKLK